MIMQEKYWINSVLVSGKFHRINGATTGSHSGKPYLRFSVRTETIDTATGTFRPNFIEARTYIPELIDYFGEALKEGDMVHVAGEIVSSKGSGNMFLLVKKLV